MQKVKNPDKLVPEIRICPSGCHQVVKTQDLSVDTPMTPLRPLVWPFLTSLTSFFNLPLQVSLPSGEIRITIDDHFE